MKKFKFINQSLWAGSSPNQTGETLTRQNRIGVKSWLNRGLMLLITILTLGVGQMWATWYVKGQFNNWDLSAPMSVSGDIATANVTISDSDTEYKFKIVGNDTWYTNTGTFQASITDWDFSTTGGSDNDCHIRTSCAGTYKFEFNTDTKKLSVTYPNSKKVYFYKDGASWSRVYAFCYDQDGWHQADWPGVEITSNTECETFFANTDGYTYIIFNNGSSGTGNQTGDLTVGDAGKCAIGAAATSWGDKPTYSVSYNGNGGTGTTTSNTGISCGGSATLKANGFSRSGWSFAGWNTNKYGTGTHYAAGATMSDISGNVTLYAEWEKTVYLQVTTDDLDWWYDANAWYAIFYFDSSADSNQGWVKMTKAESCSDPDIYKATIPGNSFDKLIFVRQNPADEDFGFDSWGQTVDIAYPTTNNQYTASSQVSGGTDNGKLTGSWGTYSAPTFTITYSKGSPSASISGSKSDESKTCDVDFTLPGVVFTRTGYTQTGWATSDGGSQAYALSVTYTSNDGLDLFPVWTANQTTVTLKANTSHHGSGTDKSVTATYDSALPSFTATSAATGYHLTGYYTGETDGTLVITAAGVYNANSGIWNRLDGATLTLWAHYEPNTYTITLNDNGATSSGDASVDVTYDSNAQLVFGAPSKDDYYLDGWYTGSAGTGEKVLNYEGYIQWNTGYLDGYTDASGHWKKADNITLYARWKPNTSKNKYTFSYGSGTRYSSSWTVAAFTQVGSTNEWNITDFTLPDPESKEKFFVGYEEDFYRTANLGYNEAVSSEEDMEDMLLLPSSSITTSTATGAVGKLVIWDNASAKNLYVGFRPSGYGLTYTSGTIAFNTWSDTYFCETNVVTLNSSDASGNFQVKLAASSGYVACGHGTAEAASAVNGRKITGDADIANGKKGVFQIQQDGSANNFGLKFVTVHDVSFNMQGHGDAIADYTDIRYNNKITAPSDPSAAGYTFGGWYKDEDCTDDWDFANDVVTEATTLYAKWTANTLTFNGSVASHETEWNNTGNWSEAILPTLEHPVVIAKPVEINTTTAARAYSIVLDQTTGNNGKIVIPAGKELIVATTINVNNGEELLHTEEADIRIGSDGGGNGALVMGSHDGTNKATVQFYTKSHGRKTGSLNDAAVNQYVGTPFSDESTILYNWHDSWVYKVNAAGTAWVRMTESEGMTPFTGYSVIANADAAGHVYEMGGTLVATTDKEISLPYTSNGAENLLANSWTAPIKINAVTPESFVGADATIYIFNSGSLSDWNKAGEGASYGTSAGQYQTLPVADATPENYHTIPSMQSFSVYANSSSATHQLTLDYSAVVYDPAVAGLAVEAAHAPSRTRAESDIERLNLTIRGESGWGDDIRISAREGFTTGFDNGWDGRKMYGVAEAPAFYVSGIDGEMAVAAVPDLDGTVLGLKAGTEDSQYTISFNYDEETPLYLNDTQANKSTLINNDNTYSFSTDDKVAHNRFVISKTPMAPTGVENTSDEGLNVVKFIENGELYILRDGKLYNATGAMVK